MGSEMCIRDRCERCAISKIPPPKLHTSMGHLSASEPLECIAIDLSMLEKAQGFENVLVLTDVFSKWTIAVPTKDQTALTVARVLVNELFFKFGVCERIHSDQEAEIIKQLCTLYRIKRPGQPHIIRKATVSVKDSIEHFMIC